MWGRHDVRSRAIARRVCVHDPARVLSARNVLRAGVLVTCDLRYAAASCDGAILPDKLARSDAHYSVRLICDEVAVRGPVRRDWYCVRTPDDGNLR